MDILGPCGRGREGIQRVSEWVYVNFYYDKYYNSKIFLTSE